MALKAARTLPSPGVQHVPITHTRINLGALVKRIHFNKENFILEKDGIPVAGIMDIDEFEDYLEFQDQEVRRHIQQKSGTEYLGLVGLADGNGS